MARGQPAARIHPPTGMGIDESGGPVIDPTANVIALTEAATLRQDDLRKAQDQLTEEKIRSVKDLMALRAEHAGEMRRAEAARIDQTRQVDMLAVSTAAERSSAAVAALERVTSNNAETLRNALTTTAATLAQQLANTVTGINDRIASLEKASYTGAGKSAVVDPAIADLAGEMRKLSQDRAANQGQGSAITELTTEVRRLAQDRATMTGQVQGVNAFWVGLLGLLSLIATIVALYAAMKP